MKGTIIFASIIVGLSIFVLRDTYEFHYVGEEHFNNEATSYVLNKKTLPGTNTRCIHFEQGRIGNVPPAVAFYLQ